MLDIPTNMPKSVQDQEHTPHAAPMPLDSLRRTGFGARGLGLGPTLLLFVGLSSIMLTVGFLIAQRTFAARASSLQSSTSALLLSVDATRDAQQAEIVQLQAELEAARLSAARLASDDRSPLALILDAPLLKQEHSLSCESSAAAMAAQYHGLQIGESTILRSLPLDENPHLGFRGDVDGPYGGIDDYGVYAEPIRQALIKLGLEAKHLDGGIDEIKQHIRMGQPVIAWVTYQMQVQMPRQVTLSTGTTVTLVPYEHAVLVVGYNAEGLWVHDPYDGTRAFYGETDFRRSFAYLGNMALVVGPPST
jgi:uncharacterized protein YvpB